MIIGCHLPKRDNFCDTVKQIGDNNFEVGQIFNGSPRSDKPGLITPEDAKCVRKYLEKNDYLLFIHSSYLINLSKKGYSAIMLIRELEDSIKLGAEGCIIHQGKTVGQPEYQAIANYQENIKKCIQKVPEATIILETSAGQGSELFYKIEDLAKFYHSFNKSEKKHLMFCIDTCHIFAAGYDISTGKNVIKFLKSWKKLIGIKKIACIHLNDSKDILGSRIDRHEAIGKGKIGIEGLKTFIKFAVKARIPMILERGSEIVKSEVEKVKKLSLK